MGSCRKNPSKAYCHRLGLTFLLTTLTATRFAQGDLPPALLMLLVSAIAAALFALVTGLSLSGLTWLIFYLTA